MIIKRSIRLIPVMINPEYKSFTDAFERLNNGRRFNPTDQNHLSPSMEGASGRNYRAYKSEGEIKAYMPIVLGISQSDPDFYNRVEGYWESIYIPVPITGLNLDIGFELNEGITKEEFDKTPEDQKYKIGVPINITHYTKYRFSLNTSQVANSYQIYLDNKNAKNIRAWLENEDELKKVKRARVELEILASQAFLTVMKNSTLRDGILRYFEQGRSKVYNIYNETYEPFFRVDDLDVVDDELVLLKDICNKCPNTFLSLVKDETLEVRSIIYKALDRELLKQPEGSVMILYGSDSLGNTTEEVIAYLRKNKGLREEIDGKLKKIYAEEKKLKEQGKE